MGRAHWQSAVHSRTSSLSRASARDIVRELLPLTFYVFLFAFSFPPSTQAQLENARWYFGRGAGLDFSSGTVRAVTDGMIDQNEGCATVSDGLTGELLFYTDGISVWNRRHRRMPHGVGLFGDSSSTQSALILPWSCGKYLVATAGQGGYSSPPLGINYSVVDITLDGGLGDVAERNVQLLRPATEFLVGVQDAAGTGYWIVAHEAGNNVFRAWHLDDDGIDTTPVVSRSGPNVPGSPGLPGGMAASPDGRRLAFAAVPGIVALFAFDNATGRVSGAVQLPNHWSGYGVCFSPDNTKLFVTAIWLFQYDVTLGDSASINASMYAFEASKGIECDGLSLGIDGRIYVSQGSGPKIGVIDSPNLHGISSGYRPDAVDLAGRRGGLGLQNLPHMFPRYENRLCRPIARFTGDTLACSGSCIEFRDSSGNNPQQWRWTFDGAQPARSTDSMPGAVCFPAPGLFDVVMVAANRWGSDTARKRIHVRDGLQVDAGADTLVCSIPGALLGMPDSSGGDVRYSWEPASGLSCTDCATPRALPTSTTTYRLTAASTRTGCRGVDSITVSVGERLVAARIPNNLGVRPGDPLVVPIILEAPIPATVGTLRLHMRYDSLLMRFAGAGTPETILSGTVLQGWSVTRFDYGPGNLDIEIVRGAAGTQPRPGNLMLLRFGTYLSSVASSALPFEIEMPDAACTRIVPRAGLVMLELCGLSTRLIEAQPVTGAEPVDEIVSTGNMVEFHIWGRGSGQLRLEVYDLHGERVAMIDDPGGDMTERPLRLDASDLPSGSYYCRLITPGGHQTLRFTIRR
jgi:hypothetical protein